MLETEFIDDLIVVWLKETDRLNAPIAEPVKEGLLKLFNKPGNRVIFDLRDIKFIDSSGFGIFLSAMKAANNSVGHFKICNVTPEVMELFKLLQLHHVFEIYDELDACIASFNG